MNTSIITCTFNRAKQMYWGLLSASSQVDGVEFVVVDDGSTDNTKDMFDKLAGEQPQNAWRYTYLDHPEHRISSIPRNIGFRESKGETVIFTESECLHVGNTISAIEEGVESGTVPLATQVWSMGQRIWKELDQTDTLRYPARLLSHQYSMLTEGNMQNTKAPDADWAITGSNNCFVGCLFGIKRKWFEDVGGFDEEFEGHGGDDWDLLDRLGLYGKKVDKRNDIIVVHQWHEKNYPYNIYEMAEKNLTKSKERIKKGEYKANV